MRGSSRLRAAPRHAVAPEVARHEPYRKSADVFSFAMLCFELITHEVPFADKLPVMASLATSFQGLRPPLPSGIPPLISDLITRCWHADPTERPSFEKVHEGLGRVPYALSAEETRWLDSPNGHPVYSAAPGSELNSRLRDVSIC